MKPSPELVAAARQAFYNNRGGVADDPFELMFEVLERRGLIRLPRRAVAIVDLPPSELEAKVLKAWSGCDPEYGYLSFAGVAKRAGVWESSVRRPVRALARKGFLLFAKGLWDDEGGMRGAGYGLTDKGHAWIKANPS